MPETLTPSWSTATALQSGLDHHRRGQLAEASACYAAILEQNPEDPDALNLSGVIARQQGNLASSEQRIARAIRRDPSAATYHHNLARTYALQGKAGLAAQSFRRALALNPRDIDSTQMLAVLLNDTGDIAQSIALYREVLRLAPDRPEAHLALAALLQSSGDSEAAILAFQQAAALFPDHPTISLRLANALLEAHRFAEAVPCYREALQRDPGDAQTYNSLALALHELGHAAAARECYAHAICLNPNLAEALSNLGALLLDAGELRSAKLLLLRAVELEPNFLNAHCNLAAILEAQGDALGAVERLRTVLSRDPTHIAALSNLGLALSNLGDEAGALTCYRLVLHRQPDTPLARFNLSIHFLSNGDFVQGWPEYEQRWRTRAFIGKRAPLAQPQWQGEDLRGRRIFLYAEQGFGDTLQFVRYVPLVAALGAEVLLEVQPALLGLLQHLPGAVQVFSGGPPDSFDFHCPLMSLPGVFRSDLDTLPARLSYLQAPQALLDEWGRRIDSPKLHVGMVWAGSPGHARDRLRSIPLASFEHLTRLDGVTFYSFQKGPAARQLEQFPPQHRPHDLDPMLLDFADTAAAIAHLDLVLTVDTAVAHLAGALGKPVWILLPHSADWRWLRDRTDSPWYPTARLFRQSKDDPWDDVLLLVEAALLELTAARNGTSQGTRP
jgi:tetratricopeptide (TPR) repeat protein